MESFGLNDSGSSDSDADTSSSSSTRTSTKRAKLNPLLTASSSSSSSTSSAHSSSSIPSSANANSSTASAASATSADPSLFTSIGASRSVMPDISTQSHLHTVATLSKEREAERLEVERRDAGREAERGGQTKNLTYGLQEKKRMSQWGPLKQNTNARAISRFDYQPDVCKDWKETGYCGYGDSCKFLHDRGDYKSGWVLEREWDEKQKRKRARIEARERRRRERELRAAAHGGIGGAADDNDDDEDDDDGDLDADSDDDANKYVVRDTNDDIPFVCLICKQPYTDPVVTRCRHYFCETCALQQYVKSPKCAVCAKPTGGVFSNAAQVISKLAKQKSK